MKKVNLSVSIIVVIFIFLSFFIFNNQENKKSIENKAPFKYEILDSNISLSDSLKSWIDENKAKSGINSMKEGEFIYTIIGAGKKDTTGYGIGLKKIENGKKIKVIYEIVSPNKSEKIEQKENYPYMLIRISSENKDVKDIQSIDETEKEGH